MAYGSLSSATAFITLKAVDQTAAGIATATGRIKAFAARLDALGNAMIFKGMATLAPAMAGLVLPSRAISQWAEFERSMLTVQVKSKGTREEYEKLIQTTRKYARESSWTAQEVAKTQAAMASGSNFSMQEISDTFQAVLDYARAAGQDNPEEAAKHMMAAMNTFGLRTKESAYEAADWMTAAVNASQNLDMDLGYGLKYMSATVASQGGNLKDALALLMTVGQKGNVGSSAGTGMRSFLKYTNQQSDYLAGLGVQMYNPDKSARSIVQRIVDVAAYRNTLNDKDRNDFDMKIFKVRSSEGANQLMQSMEAVAANYAELESAAGKARETREHMESGMFGSIKRIQSAWQDLMLSVGQQFGKAMQNVEGFIVPILNGWSDWVAKNGAIVRLVTEILVALLAIGVGLILGGLAIKLIGVSLAAICGLAVFLKSAIVMIGFVLYNVVCLAWVTILQLVLAVCAACTSWAGILALIGVALAGVFAYAVSQSTHLGTILGSMFSGVWAALTNGDFQAAWDLLCAGFSLAWRDLCAGMESVFAEVWKWITSALVWLIDKMNDAAEWAGLGRWEAVDNVSKFVLEMADERIRANEKERAEIVKQIEEYKSRVNDAKKPWSPEDVPDNVKPFELPKAQMGEAMGKLSNRGAGRAGAALEAVQSNTLAGWRKFQENMKNDTLEGIGENVGGILDELQGLREDVESLSMEAL